MACFHPIPAWRDSSGSVVLNKRSKDPESHALRLPCGKCLGCQQARAREWAYRCSLELRQHTSSAFTTLTYSDDHLPLTLLKEDLQKFIRDLRYRVETKLRYFASGEYGEHTKRPHYHAIIYGLPPGHFADIEKVWAKGHCRTYPAEDRSIAYVAGYTAKKQNDRQRQQDRFIVDPETGELLSEWQPPFIVMSRRPGIAAAARGVEGYGPHTREALLRTNSWRLYAIHNGVKIPVPRYLHKAWDNYATPEQKEETHIERLKTALNRDTSTEALEQQELNALARQRQRAAKRNY